ncbi:MAG: Fe-S cluster assembly ATPase SufC [Gammaproteobacteria bacterium]|nr:Fe-S cluster assembly ATPase SufC [Gammaproteobacteria bacterium]
MLSIKNLHVVIDNKEIIKGLDLEVGAGEVHAIMGPNGAGKSTLAHILSGRDGYTVTQGKVLYKGNNLLSHTTEERSHKGIFLAMQYPVELPGVNNIVFLKEALNSIRVANGKKAIDSIQFMKLIREKAEQMKIPAKLLKRDVNTGFSGGEKKRNEILQMAILEPDLAIMDETDSGLDIDALRIVADGVNSLRNKNRAMIVITHYQRLLDYIQPDYVHVLSDGKIVRSGTKELAIELEEKGYGWLSQGAAA